MKSLGILFFEGFSRERGSNKRRVMKEQRADWQLVKRMLGGEETAFEEFFGLYFPGLYRFALIRLNQDADAAEEVVQNALFKAISKLKTFRGEAALFSWLCTFCRYEISDYFKGAKQRQLIQDVPEVLAALESLLTATEDRPDQAILKKQIAGTVQVALDSLPPRYANALEWKYIEGLSVKEIAARLNLGDKATESTLTRARQAFRDAFLSLTNGIAWAREAGLGG
jgi:RNA polymerase sigma-70 factor, ECF subfamily